MKKFAPVVIVICALISYWAPAQNERVDIKSAVDSINMIKPQPLPVFADLVHPYIINVKNQDQFDSIDEQIKAAITKGEQSIRVVIKKGTYIFHENHVSLKEITYNGCISVEGKDVVVTSCENFRNPLEEKPWPEMRMAEGLIRVQDITNKICLLPYRNSSTEFSNISQIQVTKSYKAPVYNVVDVNSEGILFYADDLKYNSKHIRKDYSVNSDYIINGSFPRFRAYDTSIITKAEATCFLKIENSNLGSLIIKDIQFHGNKEGVALIRIQNVNTTGILIQKCRFNRIFSRVAIFDKTSNVVFDNNIISNTAGDEVRFVHGCDNARVTNNLFDNCGNAMNQSFCVMCRESTYYIAHNIFRDFNYCAIGVGVWHGFTKESVCNGIIEYNEIYYTPKYLSQKEKHTLMDSGTIYVWTQNDDVIIRYNYIHDYEGMCDNRGIFCDDGANNLKIYGNVILNTPNSYSIDSRYVADQQAGFANNSNNLIAYNVVENAILFKGSWDGGRNSIKGTNYILHKKGVKYLRADYKSLTQNEDDVLIYCKNILPKGVDASEESWAIIKQNPCYGSIHQYLKR